MKGDLVIVLTTCDTRSIGVCARACVCVNVCAYTQVSRGAERYKEKRMSASSSLWTHTRIPNGDTHTHTRTRAVHTHWLHAITQTQWAKNKLPVCKYINAALSCDLCPLMWKSKRELTPEGAACSNLTYMRGNHQNEHLTKDPIQAISTWCSGLHMV